SRASRNARIPAGSTSCSTGKLRGNAVGTYTSLTRIDSLPTVASLLRLLPGQPRAPGRDWALAQRHCACALCRSPLPLQPVVDQLTQLKQLELIGRQPGLHIIAHISQENSRMLKLTQYPWLARALRLAMVAAFAGL